ncbi:MAG: LEA type 2 family protein [Desulfobulbus sp.]|jgi:LEA14-like dessication related protein
MFFSGSSARWAAGLFVCCLLLCLAGCTQLYGLREEPKISVADIRVQEVKAMEGVFLIKLRVLNPNEVALDLHGVDCDLEINNRHFASGISAVSQSVPAMGTVVVPVQVYASVLDMIASVADLMRTVGRRPSDDNPVPYKLHGTVKIGAGGFKKDIGFQSDGEISFKGLLQGRS